MNLNDGGSSNLNLLECQHNHMILNDLQLVSGTIAFNTGALLTSKLIPTYMLLIKNTFDTKMTSAESYCYIWSSGFD